MSDPVAISNSKTNANGRFNTPPSTPAAPGGPSSNNKEVLTREEKAEQAAQNIFGKDYFSKNGIIMSEYEANFLENARIDQLREDDKRSQLNKKASIQLNTRAISRGAEKFVTQGSSTEIDFCDTKFESNKLNTLDLAEVLKKTPRPRKQMAPCGHGLTCLLSCQEGQPYKTLGTVLTNTSDLIRSCLLDDVERRMDKQDKTQQRTGTPGIRRLNQRTGNRPQSRRDKRSKDGATDENTKSEVLQSKASGAHVMIVEAKTPGGDISSSGRAGSARQSVVAVSGNTFGQGRLSSVLDTDLPNDSAGLNLIREQLSLSGKMRTDVSGTLDLNTALDHRVNHAVASPCTGVPSASPNTAKGSTGDKMCPEDPPRLSHYKGDTKAEIKRKQSRCSERPTLNATPWRAISVKTRPQTIHTIAENQILMQQKIVSTINQVTTSSMNSSPRSEPNDRTGKARKSGEKAKNVQLGRKKHRGWSKVQTIGKLATATKRARDSAATKMIQNVEDVESIQDGLRFLTLLNKLLCALYNLKKNSVKAPEPLTETALKELLNSDIELDDEGRPRPKIVIKPPKPNIANLLFARRQSQAPSKMVEGSKEGRKSKLQMFAFRNKGILSNAVKISKIMKDQPKVATWEDLLVVDVATGEIPHPQSPLKNLRGKGMNAMQHGKDGGNGGPKQQPLWLRDDRHGVEFLAAAQASVNDPLGALLDNVSLKACKNDKVAKMRKEFEQTKAGLSKELNLELEYRKQQQALLVRNKLLSLELGPIASVALEKMRRDANKKVKDEQLLTPLQTPAWFSKLERKYEGYMSCRTGLHDIGRFQRYPVSDMCDTSKLSSCHDIQQNKKSFLRALDKLCLLMGSLPMNEVLMCQYPLAFQYIIREILGFPDTIYQHWLRLRTSGRLTNYISMCSGDAI